MILKIKKRLPVSLSSVLYFMRKRRKAQGAFPEITDQLRAGTPVSAGQEMSVYG